MIIIISQLVLYLVHKGIKKQELCSDFFLEKLLKKLQDFQNGSGRATFHWKIQ
jgi:hypothetical protein